VKKLLYLIILFVLPVSSALAAGVQEEYNVLMKNYNSAKSAADWRACAVKFEQFSKRTDLGIYKANAFYWLGECYYDLHEYNQALSAFEKALTVSDSYKERDARVKVIYCYLKLGWNDNAKWEVARFLKDYPNDKDSATIGGLAAQ